VGFHYPWATLQITTTCTISRSFLLRTSYTWTPRRAARASEHAGHGPTDDATGSAEDAWRRVRTSGSGGLQIAVALEYAADEFALVKVASGGSGSEADNSAAVGATQNLDRGKSNRGDPPHSPNATDSRSPYEVFRSYGTPSVSDLVRPAWYIQVSPPFS
jgi:hypothetical protein